MIDAELDRWLHRLPLIERVRLERRDAEQDAYRIPKAGVHARCSCCGGRLGRDDVADPLKRCRHCRKHRRRPGLQGSRSPGRRL